MKINKIISLLCLALLLLPVAALAEYDFGNYSTEELYEMRNALNVELYNRKNNEESTTLLPDGIYVVGEDIASGEYVFTLTFMSGYTTYYDNYPRQSAYIRFYKNREDAFAHKSGTVIKVLEANSVGASYRFTLTDGLAIYLSDGIWDVQKAPVFAFAP